MQKPLGGLLSLLAKGAGVKRCLIGKQLFFSMTHRIMDRLTGNMEIVSNLSEREIFIIV